jgi:putative endonuclease
MKKAQHILLGKKGEDIAVRALRRKGYVILHRNVRIGRRDEIDIIAYDHDANAIVFVEVKTRATYSDDFYPALNMTRRKCDGLSRSAEAWIDCHRWNEGYRIDAMYVAAGNVVGHLQNITGWL